MFYVILRINGDYWNKLNSLVGLGNGEEMWCVFCNAGIKFMTNFSVQGLMKLAVLQRIQTWDVPVV
jgi:hypothetical protein